MNWIAIIVGALVPMVLGFIWYNKALFGNAWMKSIGKTEEDLKKGNMGMIFGVSFLLAAVLAYTMAEYMGYHKPEDQTFIHGMFHGARLALMVAAPVLITNSLFEHRNWTNIFINLFYWVLAIALIGGVVTLFM